jgi:RHS repeat-associated protein
LLFTPIPGPIACKDSYLDMIEMGARWYDPRIARWASADTIIPDLANPQSLGRFAYVHGNPLKYVDPTGHMTEYNCADGYCRGRASGSQEPQVQAMAVDQDPEPSKTSLPHPGPKEPSGLSGGGAYGQVSYAFDPGVGASIQMAAVDNWNSEQSSLTFSLGIYGTAGIPNAACAGGSTGILLPFHYSDNEMLPGMGVYIGGEGQVNAWGKFGLEGGWSGERELIKVEPGRYILEPAYDLGTGRQPFMVYGGGTAGACLVPTGGDLNGSAGVSYTPLMLTFERNPFNWRERGRIVDVYIEYEPIVAAYEIWTRTHGSSDLTLK